MCAGPTKGIKLQCLELAPDPAVTALWTFFLDVDHVKTTRAPASRDQSVVQSLTERGHCIRDDGHCIKKKTNSGTTKSPCV